MRRWVLPLLAVGASACAQPETSALYGGVPLGPFAPTALLAVVQACTFVGLIGGAALGVAAARRLPRSERWGLLALATLAVAARLLAPAVPHDVNHRAWGAYSDAPLPVERGLGLPALGRLLHAVVPRWDQSEQWLFHAQAVVGAAAALALYAWVRQVGRGADDSARARLAAVAGLVLALATPHVRFSHTDAQQVGSLTLGLIGLAAWARHARSPSATHALVAGAALAASATGRLECVPLPAMVALLALVDPARVPWRHPATVPVLIASVGVAAWHTTALLVDNPTWDAWSYRVQVDGPQGEGHALLRVGPQHMLVLDPTYTHPVLVLAAVAGLVLTPLSRLQRAALVVATVVLANVVPVWSPVGGGMLAIARYQLASLPWLAVLVAGTASYLLDEAGQLTSAPARALGRLGIGGALLGGLGATLPLNFVPTTHSAEYAFVRGVLVTPPAAMAPGCTLLVDTWGPDTGLAFPQHLVRMLDPRVPCWHDECPERDWKVVDTQIWDHVPAECLVYYRAASCASAVVDGVAAADTRCTGPGPGWRAEPLVEAALPARQWVFDVPTTPTRTVGFYRLVPAAGRGTP